MTKKVLKRQIENEIRLGNMNIRENFQSSISQHQKLRMQLNQQHKKMVYRIYSQVAKIRSNIS